MDALGDIAISGAVGFLLSLTPIPALPFAFRRGLTEHRAAGGGWTAFYLLNAIPFLILPALFVLAASMRGTLSAIVFAIAMYWPLLGHNARNKP